MGMLYGGEVGFCMNEADEFVGDSDIVEEDEDEDEDTGEDGGTIAEDGR
jgi:hypothetical protein